MILNIKKTKVEINDRKGLKIPPTWGADKDGIVIYQIIKILSENYWFF